MDKVFKGQNVFLAHCLTQNGGAGNIFSKGKDIYQRISDTINNTPEISCSTIKSGDTLRHLKATNFFGPIGIILKNANITFASPQDHGTMVLKDGKRDYILTNETKPTESNIINAIINRPDKCYNELCSDKYSAFGFFMCFDDRPFLNQNIGTEKNFYEKTKHFDLPYFNLSHGNLYKATFDNSSNIFIGNGHLKISDIYD